MGYEQRGERSVHNTVVYPEVDLQNVSGDIRVACCSRELCRTHPSAGTPRGRGARLTGAALSLSGRASSREMYCLVVQT